MLTVHVDAIGEGLCHNYLVEAWVKETSNTYEREQGLGTEGFFNGNLGISKGGNQQTISGSLPMSITERQWVWIWWHWSIKGGKKEYGSGAGRSMIAWYIIRVKICHRVSVY